jgi:acyl-CoA thioester hydrolase
MRYELPEHKKFVFETRIPIRWGDMDALGHVNNATYFRYLESARVDWLEQLDAMRAADGQGPVIVNAFCNFYQQLTYPGEVVVRLFVSDPGRATFETWATMARADAPEVVCAAGGATTVWVDYRQQKAVSLPAHIRALLNS